MSSACGGWLAEVIGVAWNPGQCGSWLAEVPHGIKKEVELTEANIK